MVFFSKSFRVYRNDESHSVYLEARTKRIALQFSIDGSISKLDSTRWTDLLPDLTRIDDCYGILGVHYIRKERYLVIVNDCRSVGKVTETGEIFCISNVRYVPLFTVVANYQEMVDDPCKLLKDGSFYFGVEYDLTLAVKNHVKSSSPDPIFLWNGFLQRDMIMNGFGNDIWLLTVIRGHVRFHTDYEDGDVVKFGVVCRKSIKRPGSKDRGLDDDGFVANFVEVEQILMRNEHVASIIQLHCSPYGFFRQSNSAQLSNFAKVKVTRSDEAAIPAFEKFVDFLETRYGRIHFINHLSAENSNETFLFKQCENLVTNCKRVTGTSFDYNQAKNSVSKKDGTAAAAASLLLEELPEEGFEFTTTWLSEDDLSTTQSCVFLTTCLTVSTRTHQTQFAIASQSLPEQFRSLEVIKAQLRLQTKITELWIAAGNDLAKINSNSQSSHSPLDKKQKKFSTSSLKSVKSLKIHFHSNSQDQAIYDILGGRTSPNKDALYDKLTEKLIPKANEYQTKKNLKIFTTTWVCDQVFSQLTHQDFMQWLETSKQVSFDLFAISLQGCGTERSKAILCFQSAIGNSHGLVVSEVDASNSSYLMVFARKSLFPDIRNITSRNTKVGGVTSSAWGIAIRFDISQTSFFFMSAKLSGAAKSAQRNADFVELFKETTFDLFGNSADHDTQIWLGNFQYRLNISPDLGISYLEEKNWKEFGRYDDLKEQQHVKRAFTNFREGDINFPPTCPLNADGHYDLGEKLNRVPFYSDRILYIGDNIECEKYQSPPIPCSSHFSVSAVFNVSVDVLDRALKNNFENNIFTGFGYKFPADSMSVLPNYIAFLENEDTEAATLRSTASNNKRISAADTHSFRRNKESVADNRPPRPPLPKSPSLNVVDFQMRFIDEAIANVDDRGITHPGVYRLSGNSRKVGQIGNALMHKRPYARLENFGIDVVAGSLKLYLQRLATPITTFELYSDFISCQGIDDWDDKLNFLRDTIEKLPRFNYTVLKKLFLHLNRLLEFEETTLMGHSNYAIVFAPTLFRSPPEIDQLKSITNLPIQTMIVEIMVTQAQWLFEGDCKLPEEEMIAIPLVSAETLNPASNKALVQTGDTAALIAAARGLAIMKTDASNHEEHTPFSNLNLSEDAWQKVQENFRSPEFIEENSITVSNDLFASILTPYHQIAYPLAENSAEIISKIDDNDFDNFNFVKAITVGVVMKVSSLISCVQNKSREYKHNNEIEFEIKELQEKSSSLADLGLNMSDARTPEDIGRARDICITLISCIINLYMFLTSNCADE